MNNNKTYSDLSSKKIAAKPLLLLIHYLNSFTLPHLLDEEFLFRQCYAWKFKWRLIY